MRILLIRHGKAEERKLFSLRERDSERALTRAGRADMRKLAQGLRALVADVDILATSPLVRARQTAEIVAEVLDADVREQPLLSPGSRAAALLEWLDEQSRDATIALVGHEPDLSRFAGLLLCGQERSVVELKKGACALIEFSARPTAGTGSLVWLLQPRQLRVIA